MSRAAAYFLTDKMPGLQEQQLTYQPSDIATIQAAQTEPSDVPWSKTDSGKATLEGAKEGAKGGGISGMLTSAGVYNMLNAGSFTPAGIGLAGAGIALDAIKQSHEVDANNRKMIAAQQQEAQKNKVAALYHMMNNSYGMA